MIFFQLGLQILNRKIIMDKISVMSIEAFKSVNEKIVNISKVNISRKRNK